MVTLTESSTPLALLDTNVLVYAIDAEAQHHRASKALLETARDAGGGLCVTPQNLAEFLAIVTDPRRVRQPLTNDEALKAVRGLAALPGLAILPVPVDILERFLGIVERYAMSRQRVFDAYLVATMLGSGVRRIFTFNSTDFASIAEIEVLVPGAHAPASH